MLSGFGWLQKNITFNRSGGVTEWHKRLSFNHVAGDATISCILACRSFSALAASRLAFAAASRCRILVSSDLSILHMSSN